MAKKAAKKEKNVVFEDIVDEHSGLTVRSTEWQGGISDVRQDARSLTAEELQEIWAEVRK